MQKFLEKYYTENEPVILACSAGPDSMYLLYKILETKFAKNLVVCYFNHKLRVEADEEEEFLEKLSKERGFKLEIAEANIKEIKEKFYSSIGVEELARKKRYEFFDAILHIYKTNKILTAHHLDDKIETFFFNLVRGTKITGLVNMKNPSKSPLERGMSERQGDYNRTAILRPLLKLEKSEILDYLDKNKLEYKIDKTNFLNDFSRNKLRNEIIPQFSEINEKYKKNISNFMDYLEEVKEMIDFEVEKFLTPPLIPPLTGEGNRSFFNIDEFNSLSPFLQKEVIRYIYFIRNGNSTIGLSSANIDEIIKFINGKNNKTIKEIKGLKMEKDNKKIWY